MQYEGDIVKWSKNGIEHEHEVQLPNDRNVVRTTRQKELNYYNKLSSYNNNTFTIIDSKQHHLSLLAKRI